MGLFDWVFGRKSTRERKAVGDQPSALSELGLIGGDNFIEVPSRHFYGTCSRSSNGRYTIAWRDGNNSGSLSGHRSSGHGRYLLLEGRQILAEGKMERPNDGKVADNGTFILSDWGFGDGLKGTFYAFDSTGREIVNRKFSANIFNSGLSLDGHYAACQTCNSPDSPDDSCLVMFDLTSAAELGKWMPASGWADFYEFPDDSTILLGYRNLGTFRYSQTGTFLDREAWQDAQLRKGQHGATLAMVDRLVKEADGKPSAELAARLIKGVDRALTQMGSTDGRMQAWAMKLRGICLEPQGALHEALACYEKALELDPKIGVRRRAEQLRKSLKAE